MDFNILAIILILIIAFLAGMEGILDQFQFHQPIIACSLVGLATGHMKECIMLGGALQLMALGWANVGAAVAPDAALASVASAIIFVKAGKFDAAGQNVAIGTAIALATAGLVLTMVVRTLSVVIVHQADREAEKGNFKGVELWHMVALACQGLRIAIPALLLLFIPSHVIQQALNSLPKWFTDGMTIGGGFVVAVGYAMVINLMANKEVWPFFFLGFAIAPLNELTLIATGIIGVCAAIIYLNVTSNGGGGNNGGGDGGSSASGDPLGDILNDY
ncbi:MULTISPECIES: PTS mannose/fructose/sorbose transporter subunit IIC [Leptotrichia]|jgi:mannose permease IIC component|uniref:PTS system alpha-glucoside-specific transporter subunit IIBC n=1 Tax=Leptotrichia wadei TaxID=157687 RepID=A0A510KRG5_9FUSO|nr:MULTISPECIES: PTS mannose/fructose/sorbose transporter subunit IIC [Leptotrichia]MBS6019244.1 PTS mannose/fructose/sorbose transporter subunit IIC [Leptotrichia wadei]NWO26704.1 PTS mannose/fructose/sorbose transporter subunit IIC [Leptotrichia sp. oral taxon 417]BBM54276.1 PTS system alpha-glucoside-specific transporter subunit IIBC [Leptotrichia wadei]VTX60821.1 PTS system sorbose-specific EIIC component [uncultured Leptotrichia sp.]